MPYRECHPHESLKCHMPVKSIAEDGGLVVRCCTNERKDTPRIWVGNKSARSISTKDNFEKFGRCICTSAVVRHLVQDLLLDFDLHCSRPDPRLFPRVSAAPSR